MTQRLRRWMDNLAVVDPIERRQATVFQLVLIGWLSLASLGVPALFLQPSSPNAALVPPELQLSFTLLLVAGTLLWLAPAAALALLRLGHFQLSVGVAVLGLLLGHSIATFLLGITDGSVLIVYQIPIALAGLLAGRRLLFLVVGLSLSIVVTVGMLQQLSPPRAGLFTAALNADAQEGVDALVSAPIGIQLGFFIAVTLLLTLLLDRFGSALREALATSLGREDELRGIRASLEASVAERTTALEQALRDLQSRADTQAQLLEEVNQYRTTIHELSVPVIPVSADTLVMPLVGALDSSRLGQLQMQGLQALEQGSARTLIIDITGVPVVDSQVAQGLLMMVHSAQLLGAEVLLVGIRPEVAQTIVGIGIDLQSLPTFRDLQIALLHIAERTARARHV
jgi:rsbT co-antagonist protein RsbR